MSLLILSKKKMSTIEYYRRFTDLSRYDVETAANPAEMLRRFKQGAKEVAHAGYYFTL